MIHYYFIHMVLDKEDDKMCTYHYERDEFVSHVEEPGILEFNKDITGSFYNVKDTLMYAADHLVATSDVKVIRNATNNYVDEDGYDWVALFALEAILLSHRKDGKLPKDLLLVGNELAKKIDESEELREIIEKKSEILS